MINITGEHIAVSQIPNYKWNADIIFYDGPFLSLYRLDHGQDALYLWVDCDNDDSRWIIIDVTRGALLNYLTKKTSLLDVMRASNNLIKFDLSLTEQKFRRKNAIIVSFDQIPSEYLPSPDSFLIDDLATDDAKRLASESPGKSSLFLDGALYLEDFADITNGYKQIYSFVYLISQLGRSVLRSHFSYLSEKWTGGYSAVNFFHGVESFIPELHRPQVTSVQYNSPGHIDLSLLNSVSSMISESAINASKNFSECERLYNDIYSFFKINEISGFEDGDNIKESKVTPDQSHILDNYISQFCDLVYIKRSYIDALELSNMAALRAILAYYRRLKAVVKYVKNGKLSFESR